MNTQLTDRDSREEHNGHGEYPRWAPPLASKAQVDYIRDMIDGKDLLKSPRLFDAVQDMDHDEFERYKTWLKSEAETLTLPKASEWIEKLKELPSLRNTESGKVPDNIPDVPAGRYAIEWGDPSGPRSVRKHVGGLRFYIVDKPTSGKWDGYVFLNEQSGDNRIPIRQHHVKKLVFQRIAQDPKAATLLYGHKLGVCGVCGHSLTDENSRRLGIGPVCAKKRGW